MKLSRRNPNIGFQCHAAMDLTVIVDDGDDGFHNAAVFSTRRQCGQLHLETLVFFLFLQSWPCKDLNICAFSGYEERNHVIVLTRLEYEI